MNLEDERITLSVKVERSNPITYWCSTISRRKENSTIKISFCLPYVYFLNYWVWNAVTQRQSPPSKHGGTNLQGQYLELRQQPFKAQWLL